MSCHIVESQRTNFDFCYSLLLTFVDVCPEEIWTRTFGGWPVWQQVYHSLTAVDFFICPPDQAMVTGPAPAETGSLSTVASEPLSKEAVKAFAAKIKVEADRYLDGLRDADLPKRAEGACARMGRETTHASVLVLLSGHILYHLGSCDAALREAGLKGVF